MLRGHEGTLAGEDSRGRRIDSRRDVLIDGSRSWYRGNTVPLVLAVVVYGVLATLAYRPVWPGDPHRLPTCGCGDLAQTAWMLRWTPYAVAHLHNPFVTHFIDVPRGVNLAQNILMPLLGVLAAPVTVVFGPVASLNLLFWLAITSSATACFFVLRRWVSWTPAAFVGGLFYGFSPYMAGQAVGHLNLLFVPIPPLLLLALDELLVRQKVSARRAGIVFGLLAAAQYLVSPEIFADAAIVGFTGVVVLAVLAPSRVREKASHGLAGLAWAALVCVPIIAYPTYEYLAGPFRYSGSPQGSYPYPADLLGVVVPSFNQRVAPWGWATVGSRFVHGDIVENGSYLGVPLLALVVLLVTRTWRSPVVRFATVMAGATWVLSLGPRLVVDTQETGFRMPFTAFRHLPGLDGILTVRISVLVDLFVALVLSIGLDHLHRHARVRWRHHRRKIVVLLASGVLFVLATVSLVPRWPVPNAPSAVPEFFSSDAVLRVPSGSVVLTYPYPWYPNNQAMLWQAESSMRFRILGGYAQIPGPAGRAVATPAPVFPSSVPRTLNSDYIGETGEPPGPVATVAEVRNLLRRYRVDTVVALPEGADPRSALSLLTASIGVRPQVVGGVDVWFDVQRVVTGSR